MGTRLVKICCWGALLAVLVLSLTAYQAHADDYDWNAGTGDYGNSENWNPEGIPGSGDNAYINNGGTAQISSTLAEALNLTLGESSGQFGNLSINNDLSVGNVLTVGGNHDQTSEVNHTAGTVTANTLILGRDNTPDPINSPNQVNFYHMGGGALEVTTANIGDGGIGYLAPQAGTRIVVSEDLTLGNQPSGSGMLDKTDGEIEVYGSLYVGNQGAGHYWHDGGTTMVYYNLIAGDSGFGYMSQAGGTLNVGTMGGDLILGNQSTGSGILDKAAGDLQVDGKFIVGKEGSGTFNHDGGSTTVIGDLILGDAASGNGALNQSGGTITAEANEFIGFSGLGIFTQSGGTHSFSQIMVLGHEAGGQGTYSLQNGGTLEAQSITVGLRGTGEFNQEGGSLTINDTLSVQEDTGTGTFSQSSGTSNINRLMNSGEINLSGDSSMTIDYQLEVGYKSGETGTFRLSDAAQLTANTNIEVGSGGIGKFYQSGGSVLTAAPYDPQPYLRLGLTANGDGYYELSGTGSIDTGCLSIGFEGKGEFQQQGGSIEVGYAEIGVIAGSTGKVVQSGGTFQQVNKPGWSDSVTLGRDAGSVGTYEMKMGPGAPPELRTTNLTIGANGTGSFIQSGAASLLDTFFLDVGSSGQGTFTQEDGTVLARGPLYAGRYAAGTGTYTFNNGTLTAGFVSVGNYGTGDFTQNGGVLTTTGFTSGTTVYPANLMVGRYADSNGTYNMNGGTIHTDNLMVGNSDPAGTGVGRMNINNAAAQVFVSESFTIGTRGEFFAAPGVTIHMTGSDFSNKSMDTAKVDMTGLTMLYSNNMYVDTFEVAGRDRGPVMEGFTNNFVLGTLELSPGNLMLVDEYDNFGDDIKPEALYVYNLIVRNNTTLDLNFLHLYCLNLTGTGEYSFLNGAPQVVPLPSTLLLLGSGLLGLGAVGWRRRRD